MTSKLLLAVIRGQKSDFYDRFKLELVKTAHLGFVVKVSWKCCKVTLLKNCPNKYNLAQKPKSNFSTLFVFCVYF